MDDFTEKYQVYLNTQIIKSRIKSKRFYKRFQGGIDKMKAWAEGQSDCKHIETQICYRDDYAVGDLVCWKEFCKNCHQYLRSGIGKYEHDVPGRKAVDHPDTIYDSGYFFNWEALKKL